MDAGAALESAMRDEGLEASPMPAGDARGSVHFDPSTGQTVTHFSPVDGGIQVPENLQRESRPRHQGDTWPCAVPGSRPDERRAALGSMRSASFKNLTVRRFDASVRRLDIDDATRGAGRGIP
jgi:hypothetical protein